MFFYKPRRRSLFRARMPRGLGFLRGHGVSLKNRIIPTSSRVKQMLGLYPSQLFYRGLKRSSRRRRVLLSQPDTYYSKTIMANPLVRNVSTSGLFHCKYCGSDNWGIAKRSLLFWSTEMIYCENCQKANIGLDRERFFSAIKHG